MESDQKTIKDAVQFLVDGGETEAANTLRTCVMESYYQTDSWMDGGRELEGIQIDVYCPRASYEILTNSANPITRSIKKALAAILPTDTYLKGLGVRAVPSRKPTIKSKLSKKDLQTLIANIELQRGLMIAVATGGPSIKEKNKEYNERRQQIADTLSQIDVEDPNPHVDLWAWYGKWSKEVCLLTDHAENT